MKAPNKSIAHDLADLQERLREGHDRIEQSAIKAEDLEASIQRAQELQRGIQKSARKTIEGERGK